MNQLLVIPPRGWTRDVADMLMKSPLQFNQPHLEVERGVVLIPMKSPLLQCKLQGHMTLRRPFANEEP